LNHQQIYNTIIQKAKSENRVRLLKNQEGYVYYQNHHILPRCLNGGDEKENTQLLTAKEHYVCHKLLTYVYPHHRGITLAFFRMTYDKNKNHIKSSRDYSYAIELLSSTPMTTETKQKLSQSHKGKTQSKETINKRAKLNTGKKRNHEQKTRMKAAQQNRKELTLEQRNNMGIGIIERAKRKKEREEHFIQKDIEKISRYDKQQKEREEHFLMLC